MCDGFTRQPRSSGPHRLALSLAVAFSLSSMATFPLRAEDECVAWPGEFSPLPTVDSDDPLAAEWARLRVGELMREARSAEKTDGVEAYRLFRRVLCIDPGAAEARAALERLAARVAVVRPPRSPAHLSRLDGALAQAESLIAEARFRDALDSLKSLRDEIAALEPSEELARRRVRLEVLEATTWVAFGDDGAAQKSLERALDFDPQLRFDDRSASPKLQRALDAARQSARSAGGRS